MKHLEWTYFAEYPFDTEPMKTLHMARRGDETMVVPHSPYETMTQESFEFHVRANFARRQDVHPEYGYIIGCNWTHAEIERTQQ